MIIFHLLCFWAGLWRMDSWLERLDVRFLRVSPSSFLPFCPIHLVDYLSSLIEYRFFSEPGPRNDNCPAPNLLAKRETSWAVDSHSFLLSFDPHEMSLNIDMKIIRPVKFSGVSPNLDSKSWSLWLSCNVVQPGKIFPLEFNWLTINSVQVSVFWWTFRTTPIFLPMQCLIECSRSSYQDTIQNLKRRRFLCVEDWWFVHHHLKINVPMKSFPNQLFSLLRAHLVRTPTSQICRTFVSLWDLLYSWWNADCLSDSFPWVTLIPMLQTWTFSISQNVFRCLL